MWFQGLLRFTPGDFIGTGSHRHFGPSHGQDRGPTIMWRLQGAGFDGFFDRFAGFPGALLNAAQQFILLAFRKLQIVIRELGPFLFEFAFGNIPVTFYFKRVHIIRFVCYVC
jgi:hypothetical protein